MLSVVVAYSSSDNNAVCYVVLVLWITSCFHITGLIQVTNLILFARLHVHFVGTVDRTCSVCIELQARAKAAALNYCTRPDIDHCTKAEM